jgi:hypothetical protein
MNMRLLHLISSSTVLVAVLLTGAAGGVVGGAVSVDQDLLESLVRSDTGAGKDQPKVGRGSARADLVGIKPRLASEYVPAGEATELTASCPKGKVTAGATAYWSSSRAAVQILFEPALNGATAYTDGVATDDLLTLQLICVTAG